jgi:hypothetical protein
MSWAVLRLRDVLSLVHASWMAWSRLAQPVAERNRGVHDAAADVGVALDRLDRELRKQEVA